MALVGTPVHQLRGLQFSTADVSIGLIATSH